MRQISIEGYMRGDKFVVALTRDDGGVAWARTNPNVKRISIEDTKGREWPRPLP
jgi:hypothetical protein